MNLALAHETGADFVTADEKLFQLTKLGSPLLLRQWK